MEDATHRIPALAGSDLLAHDIDLDPEFEDIVNDAVEITDCHVSEDSVAAAACELDGGDGSGGPGRSLCDQGQSKTRPFVSFQQSFELCVRKAAEELPILLEDDEEEEEEQDSVEEVTLVNNEEEEKNVNEDAVEKEEAECEEIDVERGQDVEVMVAGNTEKEESSEEIQEEEGKTEDGPETEDSSSGAAALGQQLVQQETPAFEECHSGGQQRVGFKGRASWDF
jgi:hypothetical protein